MTRFPFLSGRAWRQALAFRSSSGAAALPIKLHLETLECRAVPSVTLVDNHIDLGVAYQPDTGWHLDVREQDNSIRYSPDAALLYVSDNSLHAQPNDPQYEFMGAGAGNPVWVIPIIRQPGELYLGFSAEGMAPGTFDTYFESDPRINATGEFMTLSLIDVRSPYGADPPGYVSLFQTDDFGNVTVWMSTYDNPNPNTFFLQPGDHIHTYWGFSAQGRYDMDIQASAYLGGNLVSSHIVTWHFGVDDYTDFPPPPDNGQARANPGQLTGVTAQPAAAADPTLLPNQLVSPATKVAQPPVSAPATIAPAQAAHPTDHVAQPAAADHVFASLGLGQRLTVPGHTTSHDAIDSLVGDGSLTELPLLF